MHELFHLSSLFSIRWPLKSTNLWFYRHFIWFTNRLEFLETIKTWNNKDRIICIPEWQTVFYWLVDWLYRSHSLRLNPKTTRVLSKRNIWLLFMLELMKEFPEMQQTHIFLFTVCSLKGVILKFFPQFSFNLLFWLYEDSGIGAVATKAFDGIVLISW